MSLRSTDNLFNKKFGAWLAIGREPVFKHGTRYWLCRCGFCGTEREVLARTLKSGVSTSCGCSQSRTLAINPTKKKVHGGSGTPEYRIWKAIKFRCYNESDPAYPNYGGRGITMYEEWQESFAAFIRDVGLRPDKKLTLDRIDNNGNYQPDNVRWTTRKINNRNKRNNRLITFSGRTQCIADWADDTGISATLLWCRLFGRKWSVERALTTPVVANAA